MNNRVLKLIVLMENILSIYRNYDSLSVKKKIMVSLRMTVEIILILTITILYVPSVEYTSPNKYGLVHFCLNVTFSVTVILLAACKSRNFINLTNYLEKAHTYFRGDEIYVKNILRKHKIIKIIAIVYGTISWSICLYMVIKITKLNDKAYFLLSFVVYFICEIRYVVEYLVLYGILAVLSEQVKSITQSIAKNTKTVTRRQDHEMQTEIILDTSNFSKWTQKYTTLKECSNLINNVFGVQTSIILTLATIYNIILCYSSIAYYHYITHEHIVYTTYAEIMFMIALLLLSRGAHTTQDSVEELRRSLAGLLIRSTADQNIFKAIRDFLRLITNRPLNTLAFGSVIIDMSLVPKLIMFFTSYTVIALQFNNVM